MSLTLITPPTREPLSLDEVKNHLRISDNVDTELLLRLIKVARARCERATRRALLTQTWDVGLDSWPTWDGYHGGQTFEPPTSLLPAGGWIELPKPPLQAVSYVHYLDLAGTTQTWASTNYRVDAPAGEACARGRLGLEWVQVWPILRPVQNAVTIRIVVGYGDTPDDVPAILRQAMLLHIGTLYDTRASVLAGTRAAAIELPDTTTDIYRSYRSR